MIRERPLPNGISIMKNLDHREASLLTYRRHQIVFVLKGVEAFDNICDNETPADINLSGHCGAGTVRLVSDNGNKGSFTSDVKCS